MRPCRATKWHELESYDERGREPAESEHPGTKASTPLGCLLRALLDRVAAQFARPQLGKWGADGSDRPLRHPSAGDFTGLDGGWVRVSAGQESLEGVDDGGWLFLGNVVAGGGDCSTAVGAGEVGRVGVGGMERGDAVVDAC
jgi:hypothetical protein